jgi:MOSC domain-containing protein YiiM
MAHIVAVCRSEQRMEPKVDVGQGELRQDHGLVGDSHAGLSQPFDKLVLSEAEGLRTPRQVSLLALESIERANREQGIEAVPGSFAENLTTQGLDLLSLKVGNRLRVGEALLEVVQIGKPPEVAHTYHFQGVSVLPTEGVFCRVVEGGWVRRGDEIARLV